MSTTAHDPTSLNQPGHRAGTSLDSALPETGDPAAARARDQALADNHQMAIDAARRFEGRGVDRADLDQVAMLALVRAIRHHRPEQGVFNVHAVSLITDDLTRYVREHGTPVPPARSADELDRARGVADELRQDLGREPTYAEIAQIMGLSHEDAVT